MATFEAQRNPNPNNPYDFAGVSVNIISSFYKL